MDLPTGTDRAMLMIPHPTRSWGYSAFSATPFFSILQNMVVFWHEHDSSAFTAVLFFQGHQ